MLFIGVLDEEGDTLINYNMVDVEKAKKNIERKKKMPGYVAYEDTEEDEYGMVCGEMKFTDTVAYLEKFINLMFV